jgi:hypothetical protein
VCTTVIDGRHVDGTADVDAGAGRGVGLVVDLPSGDAAGLTPGEVIGVQVVGPVTLGG